VQRVRYPLPRFDPFVDAVVGSHADSDLLATLSSRADVVFTCANADDLARAAAEAILRGLRLRFTQTGQAAVLIHTSGTGVLIDNANGMHATDTDTIYSPI